MEFKKYLDKAKQSIDEDKFDIKGKSKKLVKEVGKKVATAEGAAGIGAGTAAAMTTTSLGLKGAFLGSFVAVNASTVGIPIAAAAGYMAVRTAKSYMLEKKNKKLKEELESKKDLIDNDEFFIRFEELQKSQIKDIEGVEAHRRELLKALDIAKENIIVYSGWATSYSINNEFKTKLKAALERGVNFYLGFGYESSKVETKASQEMIAKTVNELRELQNWSATIQTKGKLHILKFPNHKKILSCDYKYVIIGSFNWLSNVAGRNQELSVKLFAKRYVKEKVDMFIHEFNDPKNPMSRRNFLNQFANFTDYPT